MAHGYNTDVQFDGIVFHVQSERRGADAPVLETLVYCGGQIVHHERFAAPEDPEEVDRRLDQQHREIVRRTRHGAHAAPGRGSLRELFGDERSLGDALSDALAADGSLLLTLAFEGTAGERLSGTLRIARADGSPAAGSRAGARLVGPGLSPAQVWQGTADDAGNVDVAAALPSARNAAVVFRAEFEGAAGRLRVERQGAPPDGAAAAASEATRDDVRGAAPGASGGGARESVEDPSGEATGAHESEPAADEARLVPSP